MSIKFRNLKRITKSILFSVFSFLRILFKRETCKFGTHRHITVFMFLQVNTTLNQDSFSAKFCLMSFVKPSHAFN